MKIVHCYKNGCHKYVPENVFLNKWKSIGFETVEDAVNSVSSINSSEDYSQMTYQELKKEAGSKGINTYKMKQQDIIDALINNTPKE